MKKLILLIAVCTAASAFAAPKDRTYDEWLAGRKAALEKMGKTFDPVAEQKRFKKYDLNGDGTLTVEETKAARKKK